MSLDDAMARIDEYVVNHDDRKLDMAHLVCSDGHGERAAEALGTEVSGD